MKRSAKKKFVRFLSVGAFLAIITVWTISIFGGLFVALNMKIGDEKKDFRLGIFDGIILVGDADNGAPVITNWFAGKINELSLEPNPINPFEVPMLPPENTTGVRHEQFRELSDGFMSRKDYARIVWDNNLEFASIKVNIRQNFDNRLFHPWSLNRIYSRLGSMTVISPGLPFAILTPVCFILIYRTRPYPSGHCQECNYNLTDNTTGTCPECGESTTTNISPSVTK